MLGVVALGYTEEWYGEGGGWGVQDWEHVYTCGGCMLMYVKSNIVKLKKENLARIMWLSQEKGKKHRRVSFSI